MKKRALITLLLASAVMITPASANWFARPQVGLNLNVGSAPNPTPGDLRALYGPERYGLYRVGADVLRDMQGKIVFGERGEELGIVTSVDVSARLAFIRMPTGESVAVDAGFLVNEADRVVAPTLSMTELRALA